jgi:hypothetical protein
VGTRFDANKGRRVAVSDENLLPKINQQNLLASAAALNPFVAGVNPQILMLYLQQ